MKQGREPVWTAEWAAAFTREVEWQAARSRPDPATLAWVIPAVPSSRSRVLRRRHRYYEPVRLPTSARMAAPAASPPSPPETNPAAPVGPLMFRRMLSCVSGLRPRRSDAVSRSDGARAASRLGTLSAFAIFHISRLNPAPHTTPVYTSDPALPRRRPTRSGLPLRLWPDETFTHRHRQLGMTYPG